MVAEEAHALGYPSLCWINFSTEVDDILTFGNEDQQKKVLECALEGRKPLHAGLHRAAGRLRQRRHVHHGHQARRQGVHQRQQDVQHASADRAPFMLCVARSGINESPYKDFSMYLFPMDRPGVTIEKLDKIGNNMCGTYEVHLDNVECEETDLVGEECKGFYQLMKNFEVERLTICAANVGMARCAYDEAVRYAGVREQFGKTIGSFQLIQEKIVDMKIKIENMQNMLYKTAWKKMNGEVHHRSTPRWSSAIPARRPSRSSTTPCRSWAASATRTTAASRVCGATSACTASWPAPRRSWCIRPAVRSSKRRNRLFRRKGSEQR